MEKISQINAVIKFFFEKNKLTSEILAKELMPNFVKVGIFVEDVKNGLPLRKILRKLDEQNQLHLIPFVYADRKAKNINWYFRRNNSANFSKSKVEKPTVQKAKSTSKVSDRDEQYVLDLCDEVLQLKGSRQHKFDFLKGDVGTRLPVDIYYEKLNLVIEYREYQHTNPVKHFDKPDKITVSGVSRGEQRKIYDQRRRDVLPKYGIKLIEIDFTDFEYDSRNRILRDGEKDVEIVKKKLTNDIK